jgi:hypothetical protein
LNAVSETSSEDDLATYEPPKYNASPTELKVMLQVFAEKLQKRERNYEQSKSLLLFMRDDFSGSNRCLDSTDFIRLRRFLPETL